MTLIEFHFNVADKFGKIAQLVQQHLDRGQRLTILCPTSVVQSLQQHLQTQAPLMLPSGALNHLDAPIYLHHQLQQISHDDVLINLHHPQPNQFSCFLKTIEIVGTEEQDKAQARERYKFYRERGYEISNIDAAL